MSCYVHGNLVEFKCLKPRKSPQSLAPNKPCFAKEVLARSLEWIRSSEKHQAHVADAPHGGSVGPAATEGTRILGVLGWGGLVAWKATTRTRVSRKPTSFLFFGVFER